VAVVWDGPGRTTVEAAWSVGRGAGRPVASGSATIAAGVGEVRLVPFSFAAPRVDERTEYTIKLVATAGGETVADESFAIQVFPKEGPIETDRKIVVWDPKGLSTPWLRSLGLAVTPFENKASLKGADLLIVGREALASGGRLPFESSDVMAGLRAIVLEQRPEMWDALGFEASEPAPRIVFRRDPASPVFDGLEREDLSHWRGAPDLLPEFRQARQHDVPRRPKASNTHTVASVVLKNPHVAGFTPLAHCEWDLDYSPLIEMRLGRGAVWYSTFDITGRVGVDPAATRLARNLVETALEYEGPSRRRFVYAGDEAYASRLAKLGIDLDPAGELNDPAATVLVLGPGETGLTQEAIETFAKGGGRVVGVTCDVNRLRAMGYKLKKREVIRAFPVPRDEPMLRAVGANLLRWRDTLTTHRFDAGGQPEGCRVLGGGVFLSRSLGEGSILFVQVEPSMLAGRYAAEARKAAQGKAWRRHSQAPEPVKRRRAIVTSVVRLRQLLAQVLTNAGGAPGRALAERACTLDAGPAFEALATWHVLGPYPVDAKLKPQEVLGKAFDGEKNSIAGDTNPNIRYENSEGEPLDYRTIARARPDGFVELDRAAGSRGVMTVAYATRIVRSDAARTAQLRIGADYWMRVWVNGKEVYRSGRPGPSHAHTPKSENEGGPLSPHRRVNIELKKGENVITFKVAAGSKGFGFFAFLSRPGADVTDPKDETRAPSLYRRRPQVPDPYTYHYY
jgi:beta-galactosidase